MLNSIFDEYSNNTSLVDESNTKITYDELRTRSLHFISGIKNNRSLVLIEADYSFSTVYAYIGCLLNDHVPLIIDKSLSKDLKDSLVARYKPNYIFRDEELIFCTETDHLIHKDVALLLSTSGSTGTPKLVKLSKFNILANAKSIAEYLHITQLDRAITNLPLHYSYGLSVLNSHLVAGASIVVTKESLIGKLFWKAVKELNVTSLAGVPYTYEIYKRLRLQSMDLPSIRYMTQAGGRMSNNMILDFHSLCKEKGWNLFIMYGQTEATARMTYLDFNKLESKIGSVGQAIPGGVIDIVNKSEGESSGEVVYRGPNVMLGYASSLSDLSNGDQLHGVLHTGDLGYLDDDGDLFITGRLNRFIKIYGLRYNLDQVETVLKSHRFDVVVGGRDDLMKVATTQSENLDSIKNAVVEIFNINHRAVTVDYVQSFATKDSGKLDYIAIFGK